MKIKERLDGYINAVLGQGLKSKDPFSSFRFKQTKGISWDEATNLFTFNGIAKKIITTPADEAVRTGFTLKSKGVELDQTNQLLSIYEDLGGEIIFSTALSWDRLYGGGVVLLFIDDGRELIEPVDVTRMRNIRKIEVFDAKDVDRNLNTFSQDINDPDYGQPDVYTIVGYNGGSFAVHKSRLLVFSGGLLPNDKRRERNGWGASTFDELERELQRYDSSLSSANMALTRLSQGVLKLNGMTDLLQNDFGETQVQKRLQLIDMARHMMNTLAIDTEDDYDQKNLTLSGVKDIIEKQESALCAASGIPATILLGKSPDGQNSTGESDLENFYNMVGRIQSRTLKPQLNRLIYLIDMCSDYRLNLPKYYTIEFNDLWSLSEKEEAETENTKAQAQEHRANAAKTYMDLGALDGQEIRNTIVKTETYDMDRSLDHIIRKPVD